MSIGTKNRQKSGIKLYRAEAIPNIMLKKPKRPKTKAVQVCPQCGSIKIYYEAGMVTGQKYHCKNCQYVGSLIFEKDILIDNPE